ncbi:MULTISPECIES: transposase [Thermotoga]|nr:MULTISPECIES: transposase [Thermotoga]
MIKASRYYPSSQLCSECGYINKEAKEWSAS